MIRINKIKLINNKIFGNINIDFTENGKIFDNIVLAGINGSGKTKLLENIYYLITHKITEYRENFLEPNYSGECAELEMNIEDLNYFADNSKREKIEKCCIKIRIANSNTYSTDTKFFTNDREVGLSCVNEYGNRVNSIPTLKSYYSSVDINYIPRNNINGVTNRKLDDEKNMNTSDIAGDIIQLFIDICTQDAHDLSEWVDNNKDKVPPDEIKHVRMSRFIKAFDGMFKGEIKFKKISNNSIPIFEKNGKDVEITSLSSGEKQIIFRGASILKNINILKGNPIFIDEPEISMHPMWQQRILSYYKDLIKDENGNQASQLFIATHSEHILKSSLESDNDIIIKLKDNLFDKFYKGGIGKILPTITLAEIKYSIFDINTIDFHILLYSYIHNNIVNVDRMHGSIKSIDDWFLNNNCRLLKNYTYVNYTYQTLPTYIRNCIDHPDSTYAYSEEELSKSIKYMVSIIT